MAEHPTVYIIASDNTRNGKTLLARMLADYLLLDGHDPFLIDTDVPDAPLRTYFPGRTQVADFANVQGQMKIFDTILASTGRDYVIDLKAEHTHAFFQTANELNFSAELATHKFRTFVFYIVDHSLSSLNAYKSLVRGYKADLHVPVRNLSVGSALPEGEGAMDIPVLSEDLVRFVSQRRFSVRQYVLGDRQNMPDELDIAFKRFVYAMMQSFTDLEPLASLKRLRI